MLMLTDDTGGLVQPYETRVVTPDGYDVASQVREIPAGYPTVTDMVNTSPFYVAHRGGSADWPEMSMHAYTQAVWHSAGALEFSIAKSADGSYFGLHDQNLQRTSPTAPATNASDLDWATINSYQIDIPGVGDPQPYATLESVLTTFLPTHVLFLDPKYIPVNQLDDLLDYILSFPGAVDRVVGKGFGVAIQWPQKLADVGLTSWGYFYEANLGDFAVYAGKWDIVGMEHTAAQTTWDDLRLANPSAPVIGHICTTETDINAALAKGADGLMCAGIRGVTPTI